MELKSIGTIEQKDSREKRLSRCAIVGFCCMFVCCNFYAVVVVAVAQCWGLKKKQTKNGCACKRKEFGLFFFRLRNNRI